MLTTRFERGLNGSFAWEEKEAKIYWRGSTTGGRSRSGNYERFHRERAIELTQNSSNLFDIAFTDTVQCEDNDCDSLRRKYRFSSRASFEKNFRYKYLLDMDGNTFSGRFFIFLFSGSLVFKATIFREYFEDWLKPYEHYIPVEMDFSDLKDGQWIMT